MGKAMWVRAMASREWSMARKASGWKRVLKSRRSSGITGVRVTLGAAGERPVKDERTASEKRFAKSERAEGAKAGWKSASSLEADL
jgi:hypothetical protein